MINLIYILVFVSVSTVYIKNALHMFQQNKYELLRYSKWLFTSKKKYLKKYTLIYVVIMFILLFLKNSYILHLIIISISIIYSVVVLLEENKIKYIKELVITSRIKRTMGLLLVIEIYLFYFLIDKNINNISIIGIYSIIVPYILIYPVGLILKPIELSIKKYYENDAKKIINSNPNLIKIGITGSYGKTTCKNIINEILSKKYYSLMTPHSYNTPMGITRTIREYYKNIHEVFVCEMGADHIDDISYLMNMIHPKYGIVSSIGPQHLNTFGSIDNIIKEKMQMIERLPEDGVGFINIDNDYINNYQINNVCKIITVGIVNSKADYQARSIKYTKNGISFTVKIGRSLYKFNSKLLGEHNVINILLAIAIGVELGISINDIQKIIAEIPQIKHRLEAKVINGFNFIDDAFNSNPIGCKNALDVLMNMSGKRIVVTPGLIDLGALENRSNYEFGKYMLNRADYVVLVGKNQTRYIYKGLNDIGYDLKNVLIVNTIYEAYKYIFNNFTNRDTILLENDLPDVYNS